ncbi:hypothetical protein HN873_029670 [Arachis hypogaea]
MEHLWLVLRYVILNLKVIQAAISLAKQEGLFVSLDLASFEAGALVHVYTDGTILVTHEGVKIGQSLHTKVAQIAASAFNIPLSSVFISDTSTDKVPNSSPTAEAVVLICMEQRYKRLEVLSAFTNALFLLFMSFSLAVEAPHALIQDESEHK